MLTLSLFLGLQRELDIVLRNVETNPQMRPQSSVFGEDEFAGGEVEADLVHFARIRNGSIFEVQHLLHIRVNSSEIGLLEATLLEGEHDRLEEYLLQLRASPDGHDLGGAEHFLVSSAHVIEADEDTRVAL